MHQAMHPFRLSQPHHYAPLCMFDIPLTLANVARKRQHYLSISVLRSTHLPHAAHYTAQHTTQPQHTHPPNIARRDLFSSSSCSLALLKCNSGISWMFQFYLQFCGRFAFLRREKRLPKPHIHRSIVKTVRCGWTFWCGWLCCASQANIEFAWRSFIYAIANPRKPSVINCDIN